MTDFNKNDYIYIILMLTLTLIVCISINIIGSKFRFKKPNKVKTHVYEIIVKDPICKCDIKYYSDSVTVSGLNTMTNRMVHFKSDGVEYEIDNDLVKSICIKH